MERLTLEPIGIIHSEHHDPRQTPIQPVCAEGSPGRLEVFPQYAEGLDDIEGFSHLHLIYWLHRAADIASSVAGPSPLKVVPFLDNVPRGVFATRTPASSIGLPLQRASKTRQLASSASTRNMGICSKSRGIVQPRTETQDPRIAGSVARGVRACWQP